MNKDTKNFFGTIGAIALVLGTASMLQGHIALADEVHESLFDKQSDTVTAMIKSTRTKRLAKYRVTPSVNSTTTRTTTISTTAPKKTTSIKTALNTSQAVTDAQAQAKAQAAANQAYQQQQYDQYLAQLRAQRATRISSAS